MSFYTCLPGRAANRTSGDRPAQVTVNEVADLRIELSRRQAAAWMSGWRAGWTASRNTEHGLRKARKAAGR